ncbi:MAG: hypothetical protein WA347_04585 [Rhabdochlamydiaceae bacterium]
MSIQLNRDTSFHSCQNFSTINNLRQAEPGKPGLLQLPNEILRLITQEVVAGSTPLGAAISAVELGRVSVLTHLITHDTNFASIINNKEKFDPTVIQNLQQLRVFLDDERQNYGDPRLDSFYNKLFGPDAVFKNLGEPLKILGEPLKIIESEQDIFKVVHAIFIRIAELHTISPNSDEFLILGAFVAVRNEAELVEHFTEQVLSDVSNAYAQQPIEKITINSYKDKIKKIAQFLPSVTSGQCEFILRQAILNVHGAALTAIGNEFSGVANDRFLPIKDDLRNARMQERNEIEKKLAHLCGPNSFNGAIHDAFQDKMHAEMQKNACKSEYFSQLEKGLNPSEQKYDYLVIEQGKKVEAAFKAYTESYEYHQRKSIKHDSLVAELAWLAVWKDGKLCGGKKMEIEIALQDEKLSTDAEERCKKIGQFYHQLALPIDEDNQFELYHKLHEIIGN